ncbi:MAG: signal peptidase II [Candidatus Omnitrophota bacterium]
MPGRERKSRIEITLIYVAVFLVFLLDQASKYFVMALIEQGQSVPVIKNLLHITLVYNTGAAFGMLKAQPRLFVIIAILAIILINYILLRRSFNLNIMEKVALCFILAGTLGNLADRLRLGYVVDFIDLRIWPVFNLADSFIAIGAVILAWSLFLGARRKNA